MNSADNRKISIWGAGTSRTLRPIWVAEELRIEYDLMPIAPRSGETKTAEFTRLNGKQKIPFLVDGEVELSESVAICRYLIEKYPSTEIWHPESLIDRAKQDEWCCYIYGEIDESGLYVMRRHRDLAHIYGEAPEAVLSSAEYVSRHFEVLNEHLVSNEYLMHQGFSLADLLLVTCLDWAVAYDIELPVALVTYQQNINARPALKRAKKTNYAVEI
ncbi:MAG: glutathione S-transferase [Candidatus Azotimanducaceae bacterium]|jgi:glutathione S-transferase